MKVTWRQPLDCGSYQWTRRWAVQDPSSADISHIAEQPPDFPPIPRDQADSSVQKTSPPLPKTDRYKETSGTRNDQRIGFDITLARTRQHNQMRRIYAQKGDLRSTRRNETGSGPFVYGAKRPVNRGQLNRGMHQQTHYRDSSKTAPTLLTSPAILARERGGGKKKEKERIWTWRSCAGARGCRMAGA